MALGPPRRERGGAAPAPQGIPHPARGYKVPVGEIDIIARRGRLVAFVEVKARASADAANEALNPRQRRRIERAAGWFLAQHPDIGACDLRYDLMLVTPWRWPVHIGDAWR